MVLLTSQTLTLLVASLMVGNEIAVGAFVHPQLYKLDDKTHAAAAQVFARVYGAAMPFWYGLTLVLTIAIALLIRQSGIPFLIAILSAVLWLVSILLTVTQLVPINNQVSGWGAELPPDWKHLRRRWDGLHRVRVFILMGALLCLTIACLTAASFQPVS